jgi:hypothetical protein
MNMRWIGWALGSVGVLYAASACTLASPTHIDVEPSADTGDDDGGTSSTSPKSTAPNTAAGGASCPLAKVDPSKLTACGNGHGHCYDKTKTPAPDTFHPCPDASQVCIEDTILQAGGAKLKTCTSLIGGPNGGACMDMDLVVVPAQFQSQISLLKKDVCDDGQVCVPCADPTSGQTNPACTGIGVYDKVCTGGAPAAAGGDAGAASATAGGAACCTTNGKSNGTCLPASAVSAVASGVDLPTDSCTQGNVCAPAAFVTGKPVTCQGLLGRPGICLDKCFNDMLSLGGILLGNDGCGETELCLPCFLASGLGGGNTPIPGCN